MNLYPTALCALLACAPLTAPAHAQSAPPISPPPASPAPHPAATPDPRSAQITLEQITAEPDWIARSPQSPRWLADGSAILFSQRRPGLVGRDFNDEYLIFLNNPDAEPVKITPQNPGPYFEAQGDWDAAHTRRLIPHNGDLFLYNSADASITQLTRTDDYESSASFMADDQRIAFTRSGNWYIRSQSPAGPVELQAADIQFRDEPKDPAQERQKAADKRDDLQKEQRKLFNIINLQDQRDAMRDDDRAAWRDTDPTAVPGPFYLGKDKRSQGSWLSPSGNFLLVATAPKDSPGAKNDILADYINQDGYVSTRRVRTKAGLEHRTPIQFVLLDLMSERIIDLPLNDLPTITDDPLAWLKEKPEADKPDADEPQADQPDADNAEPEVDTKKPASKPRPVSSLGVRWSHSGRYAAIMLRSHDNKDRWIVMIDTEAEEPTLTCAHHLRDEAWINWSFNEFGFVPGLETLWYLSEESNYSHLYTYNPATQTTTQKTEGDFEVRDISFTHDGTRAYMRTNRIHPGVEELEYITVEYGSDSAVQLTFMGGTISDYQLSPNEDRILFTYSNLNQPPELFLLKFSGFGLANPTRLTHTISDAFLDPTKLAADGPPKARDYPYANPGLYAPDATVFQTPDIIPIPSTHTDQPIYTRLYLPDPADFPGSRPLIIFAHGSGYRQEANYEWSHYFREHMFHTLLTREGFIVISPDFRASEGYGRNWRTAIYRDMGRPELEDFQDCIDWAVANHNADPKRVGIYGGSYGGFLTLMAMFTGPDTYAAGAALRSVTDWRHYNHGYTTNILNTPDIDPQAYDRSSPINHAEGLKGHLLMLHGLVDNNVVAQDIIRLSQRLIELEKENWTLALAPIESHDYQEPSSWLDQMRRIHKLFTEELNDQ